MRSNPLGRICYYVFMQEILFASSNRAKLEQFQYVADAYNFKVTIVSVYDRFPGIKPYDEGYKTQYEIVEQGAHEIYKQTQQPIVVEDTILEVKALNGLPGLQASDYLKAKGIGGLLEEMSSKKDREACITSIVGYFDGKLFVSSKNIVKGTIAMKPSYLKGEPAWVGPTHHPFGGGFNSVFNLDDSDKTLADHTAKEGLQYGYREPNFRKILELLS